MKPEELLKEANLLQETIVSNRRYLHSHAETGFDLKNTLAFVFERRTKMTPEELLKEANLLQETIVSNRRYLHSHAETGFDLKNTLAFVKKELIDMDQKNY